MKRVYPEKRKNGYVLIEYTGYKISGTARRIWRGALIAPRKPMVFPDYKTASQYAKDNGAH